MLRLAFSIIVTLFVTLPFATAEYSHGGIDSSEKKYGENAQYYKKGPKSPEGKQLKEFIKEQKSKGLEGEELKEAISAKRQQLGMPPKKKNKNKS